MSTLACTEEVLPEIGRTGVHAASHPLVAATDDGLIASLVNMEGPPHAGPRLRRQTRVRRA